jgi:cytochrome c553
MKTVLAIAVLVSLLAISTVVQAETKVDRGRETIDIKMGWMILPFKHWEHQKRVKNDCSQCHTQKIGVIPGWGEKTSAHDLCIPCHEAEEKGPSECRQCHKK